MTHLRCCAGDDYKLEEQSAVLWPTTSGAWNPRRRRQPVGHPRLGSGPFHIYPNTWNANIKFFNILENLFSTRVRFDIT